VLAHRCREQYDGLAFIDTGTAVPGVAKFAHDFARWVNKPLRARAISSSGSRSVSWCGCVS
jgi:hypothetical protein